MNRKGTNEPVHGQAGAPSPVEAFIDGEGPLAAALRELPAFEPPARMAGEFQRMLATMPAGTPTFEPPARLEAVVFAEITRQQAAQSTRREAVLGELARGADPAVALDAKLSPATEAWLRGRSLAEYGNQAAGSHPEPGATQGGDSGAKRAGKRRHRWPTGWWRYAGGGLAAMLALGVGLRMTTEPPPEPAGMVLEMRERADETARKLAVPQANRREAMESRVPRRQAMQDRPAMARPPAPAAAPSSATADAIGSSEPTPTVQTWSLSDDPAGRLAGLPAGFRWLLLCHPGDEAAARAWLERGLEEIASAAATGAPAPDAIRGSIHIEARGDVDSASLRLVPDR